MGELLRDAYGAEDDLGSQRDADAHERSAGLSVRDWLTNRLDAVGATWVGGIHRPSVALRRHGAAAPPA